MLGVIVNFIAVIIGSLVGLVCRKGIPERISGAVMKAIGLCTILIGIQGALKGENVLVAIVSMAIGTAIGTGLDLDGKINRLAEYVESKTVKGESEKGTFAQGLITAFLLWCIGAMTIVGSLQAGISKNYELLYTKSLLDLISSMMLASSLGAGVIFACIPLLLFQGGLVLLSGLLEPILTTAMINEITCVGSLMIIGLGFNILGLSKLKVADFLPGLIVAPFACALFVALGIG